jgi:hypothetical protein
MEQKLILLLVFSLIITPTVLASCAPSQLYCDSSYQDILKCDEEGNQKFVYQECSKGCQLTSDGPICKEHLVKSRTVSSFIFPTGITLLIMGTVLIIYLKVLKSKRKIKS